MEQEITLLLCGDVMTGRGIDQIMSHPSNPILHESYVKNAKEYVTMAEWANGFMDKPVDNAYIWGDALKTIKDADIRIINLETSITNSNTYADKWINYRMHPDKYISFPITLSLILIYGLWGMWYLYINQKELIK